MSNFWVGCVCGMAMSTMLFIICFMGIGQDIKNLQREQSRLNDRCDVLTKTIEDDHEIMKTYKFFNESWAAIIKVQEERK